MAALFLDHAPHLLDEPIDYSVPVGGGRRSMKAVTPLMIAIHSHHVDLAQLLVSMNVALHRQHLSYCSPLILLI